ncbi:putative glucomannan 4-beta-mannosyltransferase 9 [Cocos nucifera]|uniref:Putative glucomannan 4-beta-mannosyltransferase 9 n=1 Tax=Cocos nucifera TaxID=13894 RepID=A0A8K0I8V0_COCNU|nr:putative glucomannan 4-beta-mannosyltransferase 9 [Cocos nucifera]
MATVRKEKEDTTVKSELPSTFKAYRNQQYRWACGPSNLFRKIAEEIRRTAKISLWKKIYLAYSFFVVQRIIAHIVTFTFYCVVIPASVLVPEVKISKWGVVYIPTTMTLLHSVGTPSSFHLLLFWVFFENVMSMHRTKAVLTGLLGVGEVNEWVVPEKLGNAVKANKGEESSKNSGSTISKRILLPELGMAVYLFIRACCDFAYGKNYYFFCIYPQAMTFFMVAIGYVGIFVSS